jgi:hypothetical protein
VLFKICLALSFVPFKSHRQIVTTECSYVNLKYSAETSGLMGARGKVTTNLETKGRDPRSHPATVPSIEEDTRSRDPLETQRK